MIICLKLCILPYNLLIGKAALEYMTENKSPESIMIVCAHNDDQVIGCGGTIAKYASEGKKIHTIVLSYGESSHPLLKAEVVQEMRMQELKSCNEILGGDTIRVYGLKEGSFAKDIEEQNIEEKLEKAILSRQPSKIFTHAADDPHPDHRATHKLVVDVLSKRKFKGDVYTFGVWNPARFKDRKQPKLIVDTRKTFRTKIRALHAHKSQQMTIVSLSLGIYWKDLINGLKSGYWISEVFYKLDYNKEVEKNK